MKIHIHLRGLTVAVFFCVVSRMPHGNAAGHCKSQVSNFGKALKRHTFDKFKVNKPDACIKRCQMEPKCQSLNYVMEGNVCQLNNRSKEANPDDYVSDPKRFYMTVPFKRGSPFYWTLSGADSLLYLYGAAKFVEKNGKKVLYLDGTQGTYAETPAVPFQQTDVTISLWINLVSPQLSGKEIYADWSSPWQFRLRIDEDGKLCFQGRRNVEEVIDMIRVCTDSSYVQYYASHHYVSLCVKGTLHCFYKYHVKCSECAN